MEPHCPHPKGIRPGTGLSLNNHWICKMHDRLEASLRFMAWIITSLKAIFT